MTRTEKEQIIDQLAETLKNQPFIYVADSSNMTANSTNALRRLLHKNGISMSVYKNTLIKKAIDRAEIDFGALRDELKGTSALMFSDTPKAAAKAIKEFRKAGDKPKLKGAYIDSGIFVGDDQLSVLINLKSKEDLIGDVISLLQSPAKNVISGLKSGGGKLAGILKTLSEKN